MDLDCLLREEILGGELAPGIKINIAALKERYQVSLAPLREALARLATTGLLVSEPNKGFYVAPVSEEELMDLYQTSSHLEALALSQAIEKGDDSWEEEIVSALYYLEKIELGGSEPTYDEWIQANTRFHDALIGSCSVIVKELRSLLHLKMDRYVRIAFGKAVTELGTFHGEHQDLAKVVLARDQELASPLMHQHILGGRDLVLESFKQNRDCSEK